VPFDPTLAAIRFGTGLSPRHAPPRDAGAMLAALVGPDGAAQAHPIAPFSTAAPSLRAFRSLSRARRAALGTPQEAAAEAAFQEIRLRARDQRTVHFHATLARGIMTPDGFRERLALFWADHFTVRARNAFGGHLVAPYVEEAIRPHLTGRFADMLRAAATHPMMLDYLDQSRSMGPNSPAGQRQGRGLNENLARELLELHTLGVDGPYGQGDVRQLAALLTGLVHDPDAGFDYRPRMAEPGAETVLGTTYSARAELATVHAALDDLAAHPATAAHLARKIAVHFVSDDPDPGLVAALRDRYLATGGDLMAVYAALFDHPAAWAPVPVPVPVPGPAKVKPPFAYVQSALRALDVPVARIVALDLAASRRWLMGPLTVMGQSWEEPPGPDGWPEEAEAWVTPQGMAGRIGWAMDVPGALLETLPDPRDFVRTALGEAAPEAVRFAARAAESVAEGIGVILSSPAFNRR